jgi:multidrug efflux pump subunit AcrA (membrane-fusion protein)
MISPLDAFPDAHDDGRGAARKRRRVGSRRFARRAGAWSVGVLGLAAVVALIVVTTAPASPPRRSGLGRIASTVTASVGASSPAIRSLTVPIEVSGVVGEDTALTITPSIAGPVTAIDMHAGQHVQAGQVVARLSDTQGLVAKQAQAQAALAQAQSTLDTATAPPAQPQAVAQAQSQVDAAQTALQSAQARQQADEAAVKAAQATPLPASPPRSQPAGRSPRSAGPAPSQPPSQQQLAADAGAVSAAQRQLTTAQNYLSAVQHPAAASSSQVSAAQSAVDAAQSGVDAANAAVNGLTVTAPATGTIADVVAHVGDYASPTAPLARLAGSASVVTAHVPPMIAQQLAGHVGADSAIRLAVPEPSGEVKAHLSFVAPAADLQTQQTTITLSAESGTLTPGEPVTATISVALGRQTTVPGGAVSYVNGAAGVYVLTGVLDPALLGIKLPSTIPAGTRIATATFTHVSVLATVEGRSAIRGALPTGAQVVTTGQTSIGDGQRVAVLPVPSTR